MDKVVEIFIHDIKVPDEVLSRFRVYNPFHGVASIREAIAAGEAVYRKTLCVEDFYTDLLAVMRVISFFTEHKVVTAITVNGNRVSNVYLKSLSDKMEKRSVA